MALVHSSSKIVTDNLIFYADAGNTKSYPGTGTAWNDLSGTGYNGTIDGATHTSGSGSYFTFDGTNDYVELSGTSSLNYPASSSLTLSIFVKFDTVGSWTGLFTKNRSTNTHLGIWLSSSNVAVFGANGSNLLGSTTLTTGTWYNIVATQGNNGVVTFRQMYINGVLDATTIENFGTTPSGSENWMLGQATGVTEFLDGQMSNAMMYNTIFYQANVSQNYNALKGRFGL